MSGRTDRRDRSVSSDDRDSRNDTRRKDRTRAPRRDKDDSERRRQSRERPHHSRDRYRDREDSDDDRRQRKEPSNHRHRQDRYRHRDRSEDENELSRSHRDDFDRPRRRRHHSSSRSRSPPRRQRGPLPSQDESFRGERAVAAGEPPPVEKQKPNYQPTGLLAKEANTVAGTTTVLKYHEPAEARKPPAHQEWRLYVFKKRELLDTIHLYRRSVWLVGRDEYVTDLFIEHPNVSKQHAVIQFRYVTSTNEYGDKTSQVRPYLIDLESANGTKLNGKVVEASRFVQLVDGDVVTFGDSQREYVMVLPPSSKEP